MKEIRGHHLFCMALFTGHGYSPAFTENMSATIQALRAGEPLRLTSGPDALCAACPHLLPEGGCAHGTADVARRDQAARQALTVSPGDTLTWQELRARLLSLDEAGFQAVCGGCRWAAEGLCSWALLQKQLV